MAFWFPAPNMISEAPERSYLELKLHEMTISGVPPICASLCVLGTTRRFSRSLPVYFLATPFFFPVLKALVLSCESVCG